MIAAELLDVKSFDERVFDDKISEIRAEDDNILIFVFKDGKESARRWLDRSRAESWTDEMKTAARERALKHQNNESRG